MNKEQIESKMTLGMLTSALEEQLGSNSEAVIFNKILEDTDLLIGSEVGYMTDGEKIESFDFQVNDKDYSLPTLKKAIKKLEKLERKAGLIL